MKKLIIYSGLVTSFAFILAGAAYAEVTANSATLLRADSDDEGISADVSVTAEVETNTSRESGTGKATGRESSTVKATGLPTQASATATLNSRVEAEDEGDDEFEPIEIHRRGMMLGTTSVRTIMISSVSIQTEAELKALAEQILASDPNVKVIKFERGTTDVEYEYRGRFLGIIPIKPLLRASVDSDGKVKVKFPWYDIFVRHTTVIDEDDVASDVSADSSVTTNQTAINARARLFVSLSNSLRNRHEASVNATANIK